MLKLMSLLVAGMLLLGCGPSGNDGGAASDARQTPSTTQPSTTQTTAADASGEVVVEACRRNPNSGMTANGILVNETNELVHYAIDVIFRDEDGVVISSAPAYANSIPAGATAEWSAASFDFEGPDEGQFTCEVAAARRYVIP